MVVGDVLGKDALGVAFSPDDNAVEAVPAQCAYRALSECVGPGTSRWGYQCAGTQATGSASEVVAVDGVPVVDKKARHLPAGGDGLDQALGGPSGGGMLGDADVDNPTVAQRQDDEDVQNTESRRHEDKEVARPSLVKMVPDERGPALPATAAQSSRSVLGDGPGVDLVPELRQLTCDAIFSPRRVVAPHAPDEDPAIDVEGRAARRTPMARIPAPEQPPTRAVPGDKGLRLHEHDGINQRPELAGERGEEPAVEGADSGPDDTAAQDDDLLAQDQVLSHELGP
jgi:hypothetical protein